MNEAHLSLLDAESIAKEFKDFAYSISHDLGAPARAVVEFSRLLQDEQIEALSDDAKLYLSLIVENGQKIQDMLAGLLDYSRLNTMAKTLSNVDCNVILEHCQVVLKDKIKEKRAIIEIAVLPMVKADAEQTMQLFLVLLDNALKFHAPDTKPHIKVSAIEQANEWIFKVQDNGVGIETAFQQQIFKPFQRLHTDEEYSGIGMGLALAKKIVARHAGNISVESSPHLGSTFFFTLPAEAKTHA